MRTAISRGWLLGLLGWILVVGGCPDPGADDDDAADDDDTAADDDDTGADDDDDGPCPSEFDVIWGTAWYVDPALGDDATGDGSAGNPWASIQTVVDEFVDSTDQDGVPHHEDAPIQGGDTIILVGAEGHDPDLSISGLYNSDLVTIKADQLHQPVLQSVHFRGSAYWRIDGVQFVHGAAGTMVRMEDHDTQGEAHHNTIANCALTSGPLQTIEEYATQASTGIWLLHEPEHVTVICNEMSRVGQAMTISGSNIDVLYNTVELFSRDGIATGGHHNRFIGNAIYDALDLGDGHHDDFFQSHMGADPDVSSDIEIAYNVFMNRYGPDQPADSYSGTQCLSAFEEGPKTDIRIYNNVCWTHHYHGITWYETDDSLIINNTVVGGSDLPGLPAGSEEWPNHTWLSVTGSNTLVRNNITTHYDGDGDHNLVVSAADIDDVFVDYVAGDLHLAAGSPAIDAGSTDQAPADDVEGTARDESPDIGAYEYEQPGD